MPARRARCPRPAARRRGRAARRPGRLGPRRRSLRRRGRSRRRRRRRAGRGPVSRAGPGRRPSRARRRRGCTRRGLTQAGPGGAGSAGSGCAGSRERAARRAWRRPAGCSGSSGPAKRASCMAPVRAWVIQVVWVAMAAPAAQGRPPRGQGSMAAVAGEGRPTRRPPVAARGVVASWTWRAVGVAPGRGTTGRRFDTGNTQACGRALQPLRARTELGSREHSGNGCEPLVGVSFG